jgi:hypothetical protein
MDSVVVVEVEHCDKDIASYPLNVESFGTGYNGVCLRYEARKEEEK